MPNLQIARKSWRFHISEIKAEFVFFNQREGGHITFKGDNLNKVEVVFFIISDDDCEFLPKGDG